MKPSGDHYEPLLRSCSIQIERKQFYFDLKENGRGRFLRITESTKGGRDRIMIPASGLIQVREVLDAMLAHANEE